jgi:hypothetical protein
MLRSPIPNREDNPTPNHQDIQQGADRKNRLRSIRARRRWATDDDPDLIDQGADGDSEKKRLQPLEYEQAASSQ